MPSSLTRDADCHTPLITLLTDYGSGGLYVGLLHGVIARICPEARVLDLSHEVPRGDVVAGALALVDAMTYLPIGIHVAVVDPGVGTSRRTLALRCGDGRVLIGPDNGVLCLAATAAGAVQAAVEISTSRRALVPVSATFHGRDIFAPVAAALAAGDDFMTVGGPLEVPVDLVELELPAAQVHNGRLEVTVTCVDAFGNLALLAGPAEAAAAGLQAGVGLAVRAADREAIAASFVSTFGAVERGRLLLHEDSTGRLALAVNGGSAARLLQVGAGARLRLSR